MTMTMTIPVAPMITELIDSRRLFLHVLNLVEANAAFVVLLLPCWCLHVCFGKDAYLGAIMDELND
jgi:hypothetical protein